MNTIIPVASGKGGVGKTVLCANLGLALAAKGKTTVLVDLDLGGANLHTLLGVNNRHEGLGDLIATKGGDLTIGSIVMSAGWDRLFLVPGDCLIPGTANLPSYRKKKLQSDLQSLVTDFVVADLSSGTSYNTVDFFLMEKSGILIITPETTSILNAYSFLKTAVWRLLSRTYPAKSVERDIVDEFMVARIEKEHRPLSSLLDALGSHARGSADEALEQVRTFTPRIIINRGRSEVDFRIAAKLREIVRRNLGITIEYIGFVLEEPGVSRSIITRRPAYELLPDGSFRRAIDEIAERITGASRAQDTDLPEGNKDLKELANASGLTRARRHF